MEYRYIVVQNTYQYGRNTRIGYGIAVVTEYDGVVTVLNSVSDLSADIQLVEGLVERCNSQMLDPVHLQDVVADFFCSCLMLNLVGKRSLTKAVSNNLVLQINLQVV